MTPDRIAFLHIGLHKTGTTSIQVAFHRYSSPDLFTPDLGDPNHSIELVNAFISDPMRYGQNVRMGRSYKECRRLAQATREALSAQLSRNETNVFLSGEGLIHLTREELEDLNAFLKRYVSEVRVIAFARNPVDFCSSAYAEQFKDGCLEFGVPLPRFREKFEKFMFVFGQNQMEVVRYGGRGFDAVAHMADWLKVEAPMSQEVTRANVGLSLNACRIFFKLARLMRDRTPYERRKVLRQVLPHAEKFSGPKFQFSADLLRDELDYDDINWLEESFGLSFEIENALSKIDREVSVSKSADLEVTVADRAVFQKVFGLKSGDDDAMRTFIDKRLRSGSLAQRLGLSALRNRVLRVAR